MHDLHNSESNMFIGDFGRYNLVFLHVESTIFGRGGESGEERRAEPTGPHPVPPSGRLKRWRPFFYTVMNGNIHLIARNILLGWINILTHRYLCFFNKPVLFGSFFGHIYSCFYTFPCLERDGITSVVKTNSFTPKTLHTCWESPENEFRHVHRKRRREYVYLLFELDQIEFVAWKMKAHFRMCSIIHFVILKWQLFHFGSKLFSRWLTRVCYPPRTLAEARGSQGKEVHYTSGSISLCVRTIPLSMKDDSICLLSHFVCPKCPSGPSLPAHWPLWFVEIWSQKW